MKTVTVERKKPADRDGTGCFVEIDLHKMFMQVAMMAPDGRVLSNDKIE